MAAAKSGRPAALLEKDIWVVWVLDALFRSAFGERLTFKGGTALSKAYGAIDRFSEDVDLTYDIRALFPHLADAEGDPIPRSRSAADRLTSQVRTRLPEWVEHGPKLVLEGIADREGVGGLSVHRDGDKLFVAYPSATESPPDYVRSAVVVEFGARSAGVPFEMRRVVCDAAAHLVQVAFPTATPRVLKLERTFWEKATAAHVYCLQRQRRSDRFARHWYDLARLDAVGLADPALADRAVAKAVAVHKERFFRVNDAKGEVVDYRAAVTGRLMLVPEGAAREVLTDDYGRMLSAGLLPEGALSFDEVREVCRSLEKRANRQ